MQVDITIRLSPPIRANILYNPKVLKTIACVVAGLAMHHRRCSMGEAPNKRTPRYLWPTSDADFHLEAMNSETEVLRLIRRNQTAPLKFRSGVQATLGEGQIEEFRIFNHIYGQTALLATRANIQGLHCHEPPIQGPVKEFIHLLTKIELHPGLPPALGLNTALFAAGLCALEEDQAFIISFLGDVHKVTGNQNAIVTSQLLQELRKNNANAHTLASNG